MSMRLIDCFRGVIAYTLEVVSVIEKGKQPDYNKVTTDMDAYFSFGQSKYPELGYTPEDYAVARFAVIALIDELLATSQWQYKNEWQSQALQKLQFSTAKAGVEFFKHLNTLLVSTKITHKQQDILEVFYYTLCYGFKGMYFNKPDELKDVRRLVYKLLVDNGFIDLNSQRPIFPRSMDLGNTTHVSVSSAVLWLYPVCIGLPTIFIGLLFVFFQDRIKDAAQFLASILQ